LKIDKNNTIYSVSYFNFGALVLCLGGLSPPKPPVATRLEGVCYHENMKTFIEGKQPAVKIGTMSVTVAIQITNFGAY